MQNPHPKAPQPMQQTEDDTTTRADLPPEGRTRIELYTDGSCIGNPGPGGYGIVRLRRGADGAILKRSERKGSEAGPTSNNRMEITAACVALESLGAVTDEPIVLFCDANAVPNAMNEWLANWKAKGWRNSAGKPVENRVLWERLERAAEGRNVVFEWVRGHNGNEHNERADRLAYHAARKAEIKALFGAAQ